jgi:hypothetical protein
MKEENSQKAIMLEYSVTNVKLLEFPTNAGDITFLELDPNPSIANSLGQILLKNATKSF